MELRDKNGLTEAEFLAQYNPGKWPRPSLTADIVIFRETADDSSFHASDSLNSISSGLELLLIRRGGHPYLGCWALPGGFVNPDEDADTAALRELEEETGVKGVALEQLGVYSKPGRDPRSWTVTSAYVALVHSELAAQAADDADDAQWFSIRVRRRGDVLELTARNGEDVARSHFRLVQQPFSSPRAEIVEAEGFGFDHAQIVADAYLRIDSL